MHLFIIAIVVTVIFALIIWGMFKTREPRYQVIRKTIHATPTVTQKSQDEIEAAHLNMVHNAILNDNFEWLLAHLDRLSDSYAIQDTLHKKGFPEIANFLGQYFQFYCTAEQVEGVERLDLGYDACYKHMWAMERDAHSGGLFKRFVNFMGS